MLAAMGFVRSVVVVDIAGLHVRIVHLVEVETGSFMETNS